jgi:hypothetical protein
MTNKFERQLQSLLSGDVEKEVDELPDSSDGYTEMAPVVYEEKKSNLSLESNQDLEEDYNFARSNYYGLIGRTNGAVDLALKIAAMSEHPRAMEVAASLMKTSAEITKDLLALQRSIKDQEKKSIKEPPKGTYVQNNFYGDKSPKDIEDELDDLEDQHK